LIIAHESLPFFQNLTQEKIKQVAKISKVEIYHSDDHIDVTTGGVLLKGGLSNLDKIERKLTKKAQLEEDDDKINSARSNNLNKSLSSMM